MSLDITANIAADYDSEYNDMEIEFEIEEVEPQIESEIETHNGIGGEVEIHTEMMVEIETQPEIDVEVEIEEPDFIVEVEVPDLHLERVLVMENNINEPINEVEIGGNIFESNATSSYLRKIKSCAILWSVLFALDAILAIIWLIFFRGHFASYYYS